MEELLGKQKLSQQTQKSMKSEYTDTQKLNK